MSHIWFHYRFIAENVFGIDNFMKSNLKLASKKLWFINFAVLFEISDLCNKQELETFRAMKLNVGRCIHEIRRN